MKKSDYLVLIFSALLFVGVLPVHAGGHGWHGGDGHFGIWIGPGWAGWGPWWWSGAYYPYYPYYAYGSGYPYYPPQQQPSVYVEQTPQTDEQTYWYLSGCPELLSLRETVSQGMAEGYSSFASTGVKTDE